MWRYLAWGLAVLVVAGFAAVMIPGSPFSLERTVGDPVSEDRPLGDEDNPENNSKKYPTKPLRVWTADLDSPDRAVRLKALYAINRIAPLSARATMPVAKLMADDPDLEVREKASQVLYRIGSGAKPAMGLATAALAADSPVVRRNAVLYMLTLKTEARPAVPALIAAMNDPRNEVTVGHNETIQAVAASALGGVSTGTGEAVPALTAVVESNRPDPLRGAAARALGMIGEPAKPAIPAMTAFLTVKDLDIREDVTVALRSLGASPPDVERPKMSAAEYGRRMGGGGGGPPPPAPKSGDGSQKKDAPAKTDGSAEQAPKPKAKGG